MDDKMRVQFVNTATLPPLGADTWIHAQIMRHLDRSTNEVFAACVTGPPDEPTPTYAMLRTIPDLELMAVDFGPELSHRSFSGKLRALVETLPAVTSVVRLALHLRRRDIPILHTSDRPRDALVCVVLGKLTRRRSIVHVHVTYSAWMGRMLRWSLLHADALIAVSDFVGRSLIANGVLADRVHVVLNAIDVGAWTPGVGRDATREEFGISDTAPVLVTVCRLFPEKGPGDVIRAMALLRDEFPDITLLIAGSDVTPGSRFSAELRQLIASTGLQDNVVFTGRRGDIGHLMAAGDVYAMPSFDEPFGLVFLEAMAMRLPVVALANGGTLEVVEDGKSGLLSERGDIDALAENLRCLLRNPAQRAEMGNYGRRQVVERFTAQRMAADVARVYSLVT